MARIRLKKPTYPISKELRLYLKRGNREMKVPITYQDLMRYRSAITLVDRTGKDTLWETLIYDEVDRNYIDDCLREVYALLKVGGDVSVIKHLFIDRVDLCMFGNTRPIRVRIVNKINDLFDYFYIKQADASRIYGMELEHMLSPNKINYLVKGNTLIEEHIQGIPGDVFNKDYLTRNDFNAVRLAKEFVKFNERCLVQLLGDMRDDNFIVEVIPDFDEVYFRLRSIDFDQECFEGSRRIYMPQYFKENNPIVQLGMKAMSPTLELQYQKEERIRMTNRVIDTQYDLQQMFKAMQGDVLSTEENTFQLKEELADLYEDEAFLSCKSSGDIVKTSLEMLFKYPVRTQKRLIAT
ncbi:MAG: hypothetical protein RIF33_24710 [Cyclobacteriaceae bacterium]